MLSDSKLCVACSDAGWQRTTGIDRPVGPRCSTHDICINDKLMYGKRAAVQISCTHMRCVEAFLVILDIEQPGCCTIWGPMSLMEVAQAAWATQGVWIHAEDTLGVYAWLKQNLVQGKLGEVCRHNDCPCRWLGSSMPAALRDRAWMLMAMAEAMFNAM